MVAVSSNLINVLFNSYHPVGKVLWLPVGWNCLYACINLAYVARILRERHIWLGERELRLYRDHFGEEVMSLHDFQK